MSENICKFRYKSIEISNYKNVDILKFSTIKKMI